MSDEPENLMLVYLRRIDASVAELRDVFREQGHRLTSLEIAVSNLAAIEMSHYANTALRIDRLEEPLLRIERRLDLISV